MHKTVQNESFSNQTDQFDISEKNQLKISTIINDKSIDDKTKFFMLSSLKQEISVGKPNGLPGIYARTQENFFE